MSTIDIRSNLKTNAITYSATWVLGFGVMAVAGWFLIDGLTAAFGFDLKWILAGIGIQIAEALFFIMSRSMLFHDLALQNTIRRMAWCLFFFSIFTVTMSQWFTLDKKQKDSIQATQQQNRVNTTADIALQRELNRLKAQQLNLSAIDQQIKNSKNYANYNRTTTSKRLLDKQQKELKQAQIVPDKPVKTIEPVKTESTTTSIEFFRALLFWKTDQEKADSFLPVLLEFISLVIRSLILELTAIWLLTSAASTRMNNKRIKKAESTAKVGSDISSNNFASDVDSATDKNVVNLADKLSDKNADTFKPNVSPDLSPNVSVGLMAQTIDNKEKPPIHFIKNDRYIGDKSEQKKPVNVSPDLSPNVSVNVSPDLSENSAYLDADMTRQQKENQAYMLIVTQQIKPQIKAVEAATGLHQESVRDFLFSISNLSKKKAPEGMEKILTGRKTKAGYYKYDLKPRFKKK